MTLESLLSGVHMQAGNVASSLAATTKNTLGDAGEHLVRCEPSRS